MSYIALAYTLVYFDLWHEIFFILYNLIMSRMRFRVNLHLKLPECQGTSCSKQARHMKFKRLQQDSNPQPLSS